MTDPPSGLRVSDQEREQAALEIREHFAAGRLNDEELSERLHAVYTARTADELHAIRTDLPVLPATERAALAQRRAQLQRQLLQQSGGGVVLFLICTLVWLSSGANGQFWPMWVALVAVIPLLRNGWRLYGPAPELDEVERDLARRREQRRSGRHAERRARHRGRL